MSIIAFNNFLYNRGIEIASCIMPVRHVDEKRDTMRNYYAIKFRIKRHGDCLIHIFPYFENTTMTPNLINDVFAQSYNGNGWTREANFSHGCNYPKKIFKEDISRKNLILTDDVAKYLHSELIYSPHL